jgi:hypothetical protein
MAGTCSKSSDEASYLVELGFLQMFESGSDENSIQATIAQLLLKEKVLLIF